MNINIIVKKTVREMLINEDRKRKETLDEFVDGKRLYDMLVDVHDVIKDLARPVYGERLQKENLEKLSKYIMKNRKYFDRVAKKFNKIKQSEGSGSFDLIDIVRLIYQYCASIIRSSHNPNNQLDGAESFLKFFPEEVKEWDNSKKQEIEEIAKTVGNNSGNFFKVLMYDKDVNLIDIMSNIDFILELQNKYNNQLYNLPIPW